MEQEIERWYKKLWETKGARFIAANRLELHDKWTTITISLISVYIIAINLLILFPECKRLPALNNLNITYASICLSVLVLVISLIITSRNYKLRSDKHHECGRRITSIYDKICLWRSTKYTPSKYEIVNLSTEYLELLDKYENHNHIDFLMFQANNFTNDTPIKHKHFFILRVKSWFFLQTVGLYLLAISIPIIILVII